jgi:ribosomal protein S2
MKQLLEAGVHFGHQTRRWNPKMREFIFAERNGIHIIDLAQTVSRLDAALEFVRETVRRGDSILLVGTKKQAQEALAEAAQRSGQHYVNTRWLGGMLTNFTTIKRRIQRLEALEARRDAGARLRARARGRRGGRAPCPGSPRRPHRRGRAGARSGSRARAADRRAHQGAAPLGGAGRKDT